MSRIPIEDHASLVFKSGTYAQFGWNELDTSKSTLPSWLGQATKILPSNTLNNAAYFAFSIPGYYMFRIEYTSMPNYGSVHQVYVNADTTGNSGSYATYDAVNLNHTGWSYSIFYGTWTIYMPIHFYQWRFTTKNTSSSTATSQANPFKSVEIYKL